MVQSINYLEEWTSNNGLTIAHDKCQALYIGKNNTKKDYFINDKEINVNMLGISEFTLMINCPLTTI